MFGPRLTSVFASRWKALWWAASILMLAYCSVPSPDENAAPASQHAKPSDNPWAKQPD